MCCVKREKSLALPVFLLKMFRNLISSQKNTGRGQKCYALRKKAELILFFLPSGTANSPIPSRNFMISTHGSETTHVMSSVRIVK